MQLADGACVHWTSFVEGQVFQDLRDQRARQALLSLGFWVR
jgi:hypothetical protein